MNDAIINAAKILDQDEIYTNLKMWFVYQPDWVIRFCETAKEKNRPALEQHACKRLRFAQKFFVDIGDFKVDVCGEELEETIQPLHKRRNPGDYTHWHEAEASNVLF